MPALEIRGLRLAFGDVEVLRGVDAAVEPGKTLGIVGESGCGKSITGLAVMGLLPAGARIFVGEILFEGKDLARLPQGQLRRLRGGDIAMVFQDPFTSLNPSMRAADQIAEAIILHRGVGRREALKLAVEQIRAVRVAAPESAARKFPHQLSGGQRQRVMVAMAFASHPKVLIADEPTTALDVTIQAQILSLLKELQARENTAVLLISHDIGVIGSVADNIAVFYAGRVIEYGLATQVLRAPLHPYTQGLLASLPGAGERLASIPGQPPSFAALSPGCSFAPRCAFRERHGKAHLDPPMLPPSSVHKAACWLLEEAPRD